MIPQESHRAALRQHHEVSGGKDRIVRLVHITDPEAARAIVDSMQMRPGSKGMFGAGIYFAESVKVAGFKALHKGAVIHADVLLGYSLVCRQANHGLTYEYVHDQCGCNSVEGWGKVYPEYVVYRWNQVSIQQVIIGDELYYSEESSIGKRTCNTRGCIYFGQTHIGKCRVRCDTRGCLHYGDYHLGSCRMVCNNPRCGKLGQLHIGNCILTCQTANCTKYGQMHLGDCTVKCTTPRCRHNGKYHIGGCILTCGNQGCRNYGGVHIGPCMLR